MKNYQHVSSEIRLICKKPTKCSVYFSIMNFKNNDGQFGVNLKDFDCLMLSIVARMPQFLS